MQNLEAALGGNFNLSAGGLAIKAGGATPQMKTVNALNYVLDGIFKTAKGATAAISFSAGHATLNPLAAVAQQCMFGLYLDSAGNFTTVQGKIVPALEVSGALNAVPTPGSKKSLCLVGMIEIATTAAASFIPGTTNLDAAGITATYFDCMNLPANLQTT